MNSLHVYTRFHLANNAKSINPTKTEKNVHKNGYVASPVQNNRAL